MEKVSCLLRAPAGVFLALLALTAASCSLFTPRETPAPVVQPPVPQDVVEKTPTDDPNVARFQELLKTAQDKITAAKDFHCILTRQEVVEGSLKPVEVLDYSLRFQPYSLKLEWTGERYKGRRLIYITGANDDCALVRPEGVAGWFAKEMKLKLDSSFITMYSRYPPSLSGYNLMIFRLVRVFNEAHDMQLLRITASPPAEEEHLRLQRFDMMLEPALMKELKASKMVTWFNLDTSLPVHTTVYDAKGNMVEDYYWRDIKLDSSFTDAHFTFEKKP
jgi:hypothetical protein